VHRIQFYAPENYGGFQQSMIRPSAFIVNLFLGMQKLNKIRQLFKLDSTFNKPRQRKNMKLITIVLF
jgi:hypothetical protein